MSPLEIIPIVNMAIVVVGAFLNAHKNPWVWICWGISNLLWILYATLYIPTLYGTLIFGLGLNFVNLYGLWRWHPDPKWSLFRKMRVEDI